MITSVTLQHNRMSNMKGWSESSLVVFSRQMCNLTRHALWVKVKTRKYLFFVVVTVAVIVVAIDNKEKGLISIGHLHSTLSLGCSLSSCSYLRTVGAAS